MTVKGVVGPFTLRVEDIFEFAGGVTVVVGRLEGGDSTLLTPSEVELIVDGESQGHIKLDSERMPGPRSVGKRIVETRASLGAVRGRDCRLVHR